jgi:hypothetical protein
MMRRFALLVGLTGCLAIGVAGAQTANTAVSGTVTRLADGTAVQGALVTLAGPHQPPITQATGVGGSFSIDPTGAEPYGVSVAASGYKSQALAGLAAGALAPIALDVATYTPLPIYGGSAFDVAADAHSGIFYASLGAPEIYRTLDYGGSWQAVTGVWDDPATGLRNFSGASLIATSSVPGEIAVQDGPFGSVLFSTDYGLTWRTIAGSVNGNPVTPLERHLYWAHAAAGAPDVMMWAVKNSDSSWQVWRADMSAADPALKPDSSDPFGTGSAIAVADSASGSFIGRVDSGGNLSFAPLTADGAISFGAAQVTGLPSPVRLLRLGGKEEPAAPPDGVLVAGGFAPYAATMITKSAGASSFAGASSSATTALVNGCLNDRFAGSVAPGTTGTSGAGNAGSCWVEKSGTGNSLTVSTMIAEGADIAYDADYGQGNLVAINPQAALGLRKFAKLDSGGVPAEEAKPAAAGTDSGSGGYSYSGITAPNVEGIAYGPAASEFAVATFTDGIYASKDGGSTMTQLTPASGTTTAVQWWQGASGEWLVGGHGFNCGDMLSAILDWNGSSTLSQPNVSGSDCASLGGPATGYSGPGGYVTGSIEPVQGTDTVFFGMGIIGGGNYAGGNHIYRARLVPGSPPSLTAVHNFDSSPATTDEMANAMAYCPASAGYAGLKDVLLVAAGYGSGGTDNFGSLLRISDATGASPSVEVVASVPHGTTASALNDVRADCSSGVVYAGGNNSQVGDTGLYKSTDGGASFDQISVPGIDQSEVTAIGLNPANGNDVTIAAGALGSEAHSTDGGQTWTVVYDGYVDRPTTVSDIEFPPASGSSAGTVASGLAPTRSAAAITVSSSTTSRDLVGSGSGAFRSDLSLKGGIVSTAKYSGKPWFATQMTRLMSDRNPALTATATGTVAVFHRTNGLYWSSQSNGSWSIPQSISGTKAADNLPALARAKNGALELAFARTGSAHGIYFAARAQNGSWSKPQRVSSASGDTLPAIAVTSGSKPRIYVAFLRTRGSARGVYYVSLQGKRWSHTAKLPGSSRADAAPALGRPSLYAHSNGLELAFARTGRGIFLATLSGSRWSAPRRLSSVSSDSQPALVIDSSGKTHIVFRRLRGHARGLYELIGSKTWLLRRITGTAAGDREASLSINGSNLVLAFARPSGKTAGVYFDQVLKGRWLAKPQRWSKDPNDGNPSLCSVGGGITMVFERR